MVSVTFSVDEDSKEAMKRFSWVNWSEVAREEAIKQEKRLELFEELDELTKNSSLTDKDCLELGKLLKKRLSERLKKEYQ